MPSWHWDLFHTLSYPTYLYCCSWRQTQLSQVPSPGNDASQPGVRQGWWAASEDMTRNCSRRGLEGTSTHIPSEAGPSAQLPVTPALCPQEQRDLVCECLNGFLTISSHHPRSCLNSTHDHMKGNYRKPPNKQWSLSPGSVRNLLTAKGCVDIYNIIPGPHKINI